MGYLANSMSVPPFVARNCPAVSIEEERPAQLDLLIPFTVGMDKNYVLKIACIT